MKKMLISIITGILILNLTTVFTDHEFTNNNTKIQGIIYEIDDDEDDGGVRG